MNEAEKLILENQIKIFRKLDEMKESLGQIIVSRVPLDGEYSDDRERTNILVEGIEDFIESNR